MNTEDRIIHSIEVGNFDRIALHVNNVENEIVIKQGEREALTIEARRMSWPDSSQKFATANSPFSWAAVGRTRLAPHWLRA